MEKLVSLSEYMYIKNFLELEVKKGSFSILALLKVSIFEYAIDFLIKGFLEIRIYNENYW